MPRVATPVRSDPRELTEKQLYAFVRDCAKQAGWRLYHTWLSKFSEAGFPDLVLLKGQRIIWAELKGPHGRPTPEQRAWLADLRSIDPAGRGLDVYLWKPHHMDALAASLFDQGPHREGCPEDAAFESVKGDAAAQWCQTCGRWRLAA